MVMRAMQLDCGEPSSELVRGLTTDLQYARATELKKETQKKEKNIYIEGNQGLVIVQKKIMTMYVSYTEKEIVFEQLKTEFNWDLPLWTRRTILTSIQIVILCFNFMHHPRFF